MGSCTECGHSILSHRNGQCLALVTLPRVYRGEPAKGHCGCTHIQPPNSQGVQPTLESLFQPHKAQKKFMEEKQTQILWPGAQGTTR